ncbi:HelD family protein [Nocardioides albus]|uniref:DNA helicase IV n=1 Tax=Nocardioides albus TaxID=1841 RepID=A0A7W5FB50_9ACTN|nr:AAA family ATPase [Nocardioides albus]MBB3091855.1 DNA helicase IV [Nocardioides albus]GGU33270.1 DNA helicase [Nocardioides albus]
MSEQVDKVGQVDEEQRSVEAMYALLHAEVSARRAAHERVIETPVDGPSERYARELEVARLTESIRQLQAAEHSLCFGRIDRSDQEESLHIGRLGLRAEDGRPLLIDWRAEAARPFYAATLAEPMGLRRRRHLRLDGRDVVDINDEILDGTSPTVVDLVGDSPLVSALSTARTGRMHEAAATLQAEQDEIVRSPHRGVMVVDGGPGTGKTIVALHRAAYVLYAFASIADQGVLVYGPNRRFLTYISEVLPSLGENDVRLATMADLVGVEATRTEPDHIARAKGRAALADDLARLVRQHQPHGVPLELKTTHDTVRLEPAVVDAARRQALQNGIGHNRARELFTEYVVDDLVNELERSTAKEISDFEEELEAHLGIDLDRFTGNDARTDDLEVDWDSIREDLLDDPSIDRAITRVWPRLVADDLVRELLKDFSVGRNDGWSNADLALLDEARALVDGAPEKSYGHIVVDEAQQLSEMQWRALMRHCPGRSMTIVGDLAQAGPSTTLRTWDEALKPFVGERFAHHRLTVNYRTTTEILLATEPLLAEIAPDQQISRSIRHGEQPLVLGVTEESLPSTLSRLIAEISEEHPGELIGVVAATERALALEAAVRGDGATVVAAPEARGLEFDTVIIADPAGIRAAGVAGPRDLYVAQTRATKRLLSLWARP